MNTLVEKDQRYIWHPFTQAKNAPPALALERALGCYLYTVSGRKLFDGISSWWLNAHGHCHPHIAQAIAKQASNLEQVVFANFTHAPAVLLAEKLINIAPAGMRRVFYSDNGSTAVETALKIAYQYWHNRGEARPHFIALENGYHGDTFGAMAASERSTFTKPFWPLLFDVFKTKSTCISQIKDGITASDITESALSSLRQLLQKYEGQVAGIVIEPMLQAAGGMKIFTPGFLKGIKLLASEFNTLLIADEIATGFYRTGSRFACGHEDVAPDIMCVAKGLTGGFLPLAATLTTEHIYEAFLGDSKAQAFLHGHSFTANALGCAAAIASLELFQEPENLGTIDAIVHAVTENLKQFEGLPGIKHCRSIGTIAIIELEGGEGYLSTAATAIAGRCLKKGLYLRPLGNIIYLWPPLCSSVLEITWALSVIRESLA